MGEVFAGRYELLDPIGMGGMGSVWTVHDRADGRVKAAKILRQSDAASLLRFVREQSVRISHPHVVTPESWAGMDDRVLFTMPLVAGGSVADLVRDHGALPLPWVGVLLDQLLDALEAVHDAGVVHRDVKPANLLLEPTGPGVPHLRLTDFGIAVPLDDARLTHGPAAVGSPGYMAPEQWQGGEVGPRHDLYAVGRVGLEMVTGSRPPADGSPVDVAALPEPTEVATRLVAVLQRAAATDPDERPATARELREELAALRLAELPAHGAPLVVDSRVPSTYVAHDAPTTVGATLAGEQADGPDARTRLAPPAAGATRVDAPPPTRAGGGTAVAPGPMAGSGSGTPAERAAGRTRVVALLLVVLGILAVAAGVAVLLLG